jgi:uncharacterized protein
MFDSERCAARSARLTALGFRSRRADKRVLALRVGTVADAGVDDLRWPCAVVFSTAGVIGAALGSVAGKAFDGKKLLFLFGVLMAAIAVSMFLRKPANAAAFKPLMRDTAPTLGPRLVAAGGLVGAVSGFFGIGGGFLIVPGLMTAASMPMLTAVGTSLVAVTAFGLTTAISYAMSGLVDWRIAFIFVLAGAAGGVAGAAVAGRLATKTTALTKVFATIVLCVGAYVMARGFRDLFG